MLRITLHEPADLASLGEQWSAFQAAAAASFFQSWLWVGCLAAERFPHPVVLQAHDDAGLVGLALFNRRDGTLWLGESGQAALDAVFVEHNGVLLAGDQPPTALAACLHAALTAKLPGGARRVMLSGIGAGHLAAAREAGGIVLRHGPTRLAPRIDLTALPSGPDGYLASLSANTRYQIRRSHRRYAASGPVVLERAENAAEAHVYLDALAVLHQRSWVARGKPGAFAEAAFNRFHHTLIDRAMAAPDESGGAVDLLRASAGGRVIGYLYNFRLGGRVSAYQSGFDYAAADGHQKPGLTCHHLAIEMYRAAGMAQYDFLAGGDRYKRSLAAGGLDNVGGLLHWIELAPRWSARAWAKWIVDASRGGKESWK